MDLALAIGFGILFVAFPNSVHRFYCWFGGRVYTTRNSPRTVRNAGILWLLGLAVIWWFART
jgi:hypothetical protein